MRPAKPERRSRGRDQPAFCLGISAPVSNGMRNSIRTPVERLRASRAGLDRHDTVDFESLRIAAQSFLKLDDPTAQPDSKVHPGRIRAHGVSTCGCRIQRFPESVVSVGASHEQALRFRGAFGIRHEMRAMVAQGHLTAIFSTLGGLERGGCRSRLVRTACGGSARAERSAQWQHTEHRRRMAGNAKVRNGEGERAAVIGKQTL